MNVFQEKAFVKEVFLSSWKVFCVPIDSGCVDCVWTANEKRNRSALQIRTETRQRFAVWTTWRRRKRKKRVSRRGKGDVKRNLQKRSGEAARRDGEVEVEVEERKNRRREVRWCNDVTMTDDDVKPWSMAPSPLNLHVQARWEPFARRAFGRGWSYEVSTSQHDHIDVRMTSS